MAWAHSRSPVSGVRHTLADHARATSGLARSFAEPFGAGELAAALGLFHDAGKAACEWQVKLLAVEGSRAPVGIPHKRLGARLLSERVGPAAAALIGHHGGLPDDWRPDRLDTEPPDEPTTQAFLADVPEAEALLTGEVLLPDSWRKDRLVFEMGIRMAFSALVDADHLDTAAHAQGRAAAYVRPPADMSALLVRFEQRRTAMFADTERSPSPLDGFREEVYRAAVDAAAGPVGVYRFPSPTGSGKTIAAAGFGLHHAVAQQRSRVIVAVPYITITEQNAAVYRRLLDHESDGIVLEHHSNVNLDRSWERGAAENWDAPFVVTTTVQLFDSLFGQRPSRSRKLHRLANSVIVLDEVQALPLEVLVPILDALRILVRYFGTTVLLSSATQPAFTYLPPWADLPVTDVIADPIRLFERMERRVDYEWWTIPKPSLADVAERVAGERQVLVVVNTIADARKLFTLLREAGAENVLHLSTRMCPSHRRAVLAEARRLLENEQPIRLVSTQLIEAGVDVDFPVVYRALAPADSVQQAGGRANREDRRDVRGRVVVFDSEDSGMPTAYKTPVGITRRLFVRRSVRPDDLALLDRYYRELYGAQNLEQHPRTKAIQYNRRELRFQAVADGPARSDSGRDRSRAFRMIDEDTVPVVITACGDADEVAELERHLDVIRRAEPTARGSLRALQAYTVQLPRRVASDPGVAALLRPVSGDLCEWVGDYDEHLGLDEGAIGQDAIW